MMPDAFRHDVSGVSITFSHARHCLGAARENARPDVRGDVGGLLEVATFLETAAYGAARAWSSSRPRTAPGQSDRHRIGRSQLANLQSG
jgi:hypothetical protein